MVVENHIFSKIWFYSKFYSKRKKKSMKCRRREFSSDLVMKKISSPWMLVDSGIAKILRTKWSWVTWEGWARVKCVRDSWIFLNMCRESTQSDAYLSIFYHLSIYHLSVYCLPFPNASTLYTYPKSYIKIWHPNLPCLAVVLLQHQTQ